MRVEAVRGHLDLILLSVLRESPGHGYAVIAALRARTDGMLELTEGSVYPALHRLEEDPNAPPPYRCGLHATKCGTCTYTFIRPVPQ